MSLRKNISYVLFPLTIWYAVGVWFRNVLYAVGIKKQEAPHITTIGVGNLSTGGTGKTPMVEYLLRLLADRYPTAMLSRGYRRKSKGYQADDGSHDAVILGDEPAMIARKFPQVQVAVCEKRVEGVKRLMAEPVLPDQGDETEESHETDESDRNRAPKLIVLDDVFQHRAIKPNINILLTEYRRPYFNDHILPYGDLREFRSARYRAGVVIVTKSPAVLNPVEKHNIVHNLGLLKYQKVFFSYLKYGEIKTLQGASAHVDLRKTDCVLAVTGIAHPEPMLEEIRRSCKVQHMAFADHHAYTARDVERMKEAYESMPGKRKIILTTEKDAVRLHDMVKGLPVYVLPIEVAFHKEQDVDFDLYITSAVQENISFLNKLSIWN